MLNKYYKCSETTAYPNTEYIVPRHTNSKIKAKPDIILTLGRRK